jgi:hypothetical protein
MAALEHARLVRSTHVGKWTHYRRDDDRMCQLADAIGTQF